MEDGKSSWAGRVLGDGFRAEERSVEDTEVEGEDRMDCDCDCDWVWEWEVLSDGGRGFCVVAEEEKGAYPWRTGRWRRIMGRERIMRLAWQAEGAPEEKSAAAARPRRAAWCAAIARTKIPGIWLSCYKSDKRMIWLKNGCLTRCARNVDMAALNGEISES